MKHRIFIVHGMGSIPSEEKQKEIVKQIQSDHDAMLPEKYEDRFEAPIFLDYDKHFKKYIEANNDYIKRFENIELGNLPGVAGLIGDLADHELDEGFFVDNLLDVLLYLLTDIHDVVVTGLASDLLKELNEDRSARWSVVGYSLGTSVVTDLLQYLLTSWNTAAGNGFLSAYRRPSAILQIANVAKLVRLRGDVYQTVVYPSGYSTAGACFSYASATHPLDPIPQIKPFNPETHWSEALEYYESVELPEHLWSCNPHDIAHYLKWPEVIDALFEGIYLEVDEYYPRDAEKLDELKQKALAESPTSQALQSLKDIKNKPTVANWTQFLETLRDLKNIIDDCDL